MAAIANVKEDILGRGVSVFLGDVSGGRFLVHALTVQTREVPDGSAAREEDGVRLSDELARALYESLADHYGHAGHDVRALRKDYDAERARVDKLITHLTGGPR